jgi:IS30 family transposase
MVKIDKKQALKIISMNEKGYSIREISKKLGTSSSLVFRVLENINPAHTEIIKQAKEQRTKTQQQNSTEQSTHNQQAKQTIIINDTNPVKRAMNAYYNFLNDCIKELHYRLSDLDTDKLLSITMKAGREFTELGLANIEFKKK